MSHNKINKLNDTENNSYFSSNNTNELKAAYRRDELMSLLRKSGCDGLSVLQLKDKMKFKDRKSIPRFINEINKIFKKNHESERIIKLKKNENYVLASELAKREIATQCMVFGQDAIRELLGGMSNGLNSLIDDPDSNEIYDLLLNEKSFLLEFYEKKKLSDESKILLDFTFKISSFISFIMLKAIESHGDDVMAKDGKMKEYESAVLVDRAIDPRQILYHFMQQEIVKKGKLEKESRVRNLLRNRNDYIKNSPRAKILLENSISDDQYSCYEVNSFTSQKLKNSYQEIWPGTFRLLTKLCEEKRLQKITTRGISETFELKKNIEDENKSQLRRD
ncbi:MAG: hypothetical protein R2685_00975 [Candidatus Nitrosocosmicus sp.]|nr:hypothetical protein [Candidatus Nitrosocosmicus sp.]